MWIKHLKTLGKIIGIAVIIVGFCWTVKKAFEKLKQMQKTLDEIKISQYDMIKKIDELNSSHDKIIKMLEEIKKEQEEIKKGQVTIIANIDQLRKKQEEIDNLLQVYQTLFEANEIEQGDKEKELRSLMRDIICEQQQIHFNEEELRTLIIEKMNLYEEALKTNSEELKKISSQQIILEGKLEHEYNNLSNAIASSSYLIQKAKEYVQEQSKTKEKLSFKETGYLKGLEDINNKLQGAKIELDNKQKSLDINKTPTTDPIIPKSIIIEITKSNCIVTDAYGNQSRLECSRVLELLTTKSKEIKELIISPDAKGYRADKLKRTAKNNNIPVHDGK